VIAGELREALGFLEECVSFRRVVLCTEKSLAGVLSGFLGRIRRTFPGADTVLFPGGEDRKNRGTKARIEDALLARRIDRDSVLFAVGGGMVSDIVGFTAGTYLRGIPYVNIPTTLVGMVDASLGGKTAVNTPRGKNLVGVIHAPAGVCIALEALDTLPESEFRSGLGECLKHGAIADGEYFEWLSGLDVRTLKSEAPLLWKLVETSVRIKMSVVDSDPAERSGRRNVLNAGHTVAHALEHLSHFKVGHGAAVAAGLCWEAAVAAARGHLSVDSCRRIVGGVRSLGFEDHRGVFTAEQVFATAGWDKKNRSGKVNYVPLGTVGAVALPAPHTDELTLSALEKGLGVLKEL
jgi:3-dehydroquinate synthase